MGPRGRAAWQRVLVGAAALGAAGTAAACATARPAAKPPAASVASPVPVVVVPPAPDTSLLVAARAAAAARRDTAPAPPPQPPALDSAPPPLDPTDGSGRVRWVGREADRTIAPADRALLRSVFGIDDVRRIYVPTTPGEVLRYAAHAPGCPDVGPNGGRPTTRGGACRVVGVRIGLAAPRDSTETWDAFTARVERGGPRVWSANGGRAAYSGLDALDPEARPAFQRLIDDARAAGFPIHVRETYRTPERQAAILARNDGRTTTLTSAHSFGRAVDIAVSGRHSTWVEFRRWVLRQQNGAFRLIGTPESTWDWPHVEYVGPAGGPPLGYASVDALVAAARVCRAGAASDVEAARRCTQESPRPAESVLATTVSDDEPVGRARRGHRHGRHASARSVRGRSARGSRSHGARQSTTHHGSKGDESSAHSSSAHSSSKHASSKHGASKHGASGGGSSRAKHRSR